MKLYKMIIVLAILAIAGVAEARLHYIIYFRNGKEIVVSNYKVSGHQIKYYRLGGWLSVPKERIAEIEDRDSGEYEVFNPYYNEQDTKALRKGQAKSLDRVMRKQEIRDQADEQREWEKKQEKRTRQRGKYDRYRGKERKEESVTKREKRKANYAECESRSRRDLDYSGCTYRSRSHSYRSGTTRSIITGPAK